MQFKFIKIMVITLGLFFITAINSVILPDNFIDDDSSQKIEFYNAFTILCMKRTSR